MMFAKKKLRIVTGVNFLPIAVNFLFLLSRALWHEFPSDPVALTVDEQFLWGKYFMVSPALSQGQTSVRVYFPSEASWYDLETHAKVPSAGFLDLDCPLEKIHLHIRAGGVLPTQVRTLRIHTRAFVRSRGYWINALEIGISGIAREGIYYYKERAKAELLLQSFVLRACAALFANSVYTHRPRLKPRFFSGSSSLLSLQPRNPGETPLSFSSFSMT